MIPHRRILAVLTLAILASCASPSEPDPSRGVDDDHRLNTAESAPPPVDTAGRGGNVMGGGH
jgi:hypothetical protein